MSLSESTKTKDASLTRDILSAGRYYLGNRRALLVLAIVASIAGLALNWSWLVAVGLAPILLSTLPCLVMCAFGVCMMCRSGKEQSALSRDASDQGASSVSPAVGTSQNAASCCAEPAGDANSIAGGRETHDLVNFRRRFASARIAEYMDAPVSEFSHHSGAYNVGAGRFRPFAA